MQPISNPLLARKNGVIKGYAAFNDGDWDSLQEVLCEDVRWYPMDGGPCISGREAVIAYLQDLRNSSEAELFGMAIDTQRDTAITVDFTTTTREEGDHACADKIVFDDSGCIKEVWHCAADTHGHGHAGHPAGHTHP